MKTSCIRVALAAGVLLAPVFAQTQPSKPLPRSSDGKPDLSGVWFTGALALIPGGIAAAPARGAAPKPSAPPPESAPYQEWAAEKIKLLGSKDDPIANCLLPGVPRITAMPMPMEIVQIPGKIVILYEAYHAFRIIPTDGRAHPDNLDPTFMGDSVGHWDGDTLVVDVTGFNEKTWLAGRGGSLSL